MRTPKADRALRGPRAWVPVVGALLLASAVAPSGPRPLYAANDLNRIRQMSRIDPPACIALCKEVIDKAPASQPPHPAVYYYLAQAYLVTEQPRLAADAATEGERLAAGADSRLVRANLALLKSVALHAVGEHAEGAVAAAAGIVVAKQIPNERLVAKLETERGNNLVARGDLKGGLAAYRNALAIAERLGADDIRLAATANLAAATDEFRDTEEALETYRHLLAEIASSENPFWVATLRFNLGKHLMERGEYGEAQANLQSAIESAERTSVPYLLAKCWASLAMVEEKLGSDEDRLRSCLLMAQLHAERSGDQATLADLDLWQRIRGAEDPGSPEDLRDWLRERLDEARRRDNLVHQHDLLSALIQCETLLGNYPEVVELQAERYQLARQRFDVSMRAELTRLNNMLAERDARLEEARRQAAIQRERTRYESRIRSLILSIVGLTLAGGFYGAISLIRRRALVRYLALQKQVDQIQCESLARWKTTFDSFREPVCIVSPQGRVTLANLAFAQVFQGESRAPAATDFRRLLRRHFQVEVEPGELPEQMLMMRTGQGTEQWYQVRSSSIPTPDGTGDRLFVFRDVTSERRYQQEILDRQRSAEDAVRSKSEFMAIVSHEIRTPIHAISGALQLLEDTGMDASQRELVRISSASSAQLTRMIEDLLGYASIEAGKLVIQQQPFDVRRVVEDTVSTFRIGGDAVQLEVQIDPEVPRLLEGDMARYRQVLTNLLANARRHTERGTITTRVRCLEGTEAGTLILETSVRDTGTGISAEAQRRIFLPFEQEQSAGTRAHGGVGLGLAICSRLVVLMGGTIQVKSELGMGSEFRFTIRTAATPAAATEGERQGQREEEEREEGERAPLTRLRVLLVDDEPVNRKIMARMLESLNQEVTCVESGEAALGAIEKAGERFDVVLMDLMMPGIGGLEATRVLRSRYDALKLPIVALTGRAAEEDREASRAFGMNAFLAKPVSRDELRSVLEQLGRTASMA